MTIFVKVKPASKHEKVEKTGMKHYTVSVNAPAHEGKANNALITILAKHFDISKAYVQILSGHFAKEKVIEIIK